MVLLPVLVLVLVRVLVLVLVRVRVLVLAMASFGLETVLPAAHCPAPAAV